VLRVTAVERLGDTALRLRVEGGTPALRAAWADRVRALPDVVDLAWGESHLLVVTASPWPDAAPFLALLDARAERGPAAPEPREVRVAVRYDGPDLRDVAAFAGLDPDAVIALHAATVYTVRAVGFQPGFAYLGDVDPRIAAPRRPTPRARVPAGSVGIAGARTAVYPWSTPGGWSLVGTAVGFVAFDPHDGAALRVGDRVRFEPIP
jgi:UPF0271 protein